MNYSKEKYILGIGGANIDIHIKAYEDFVLHDSNPGKLFTSVGGVTRNIIDNISRLGIKCSILTSVGIDPFASEILKSCTDNGIDTDPVFVNKEEASSSYLDFVDKDGDMYIAACDAAVIENMPISHFEDQKECISNAVAIVCDTNLTKAQIDAILSLANGIPVFIDPVSTSKSERIKEKIGSFYCVKPNKIELEALTGIEINTDEDVVKGCEALINEGTNLVVVSLGEKGCYYASKDGSKGFRSLGVVNKMVNAAGAGDAFSAGLVYGYYNKLSIEDTIDFALACGSLAVLSEETINPMMNEENVKMVLNR